ncbi:MAG: response regulator [Anaerolineae bacterium]|nr:response regulator [Anaerolineae bacterium]MDW8100579.1 response regulator [Anaerolineae bacterium]
MIDRAEFAQLVREALANLYDFAALETHPLAVLLPKLQGQPKSRADCLREQLLRAIEQLQPPDRALPTNAPEWRPYLILYGRYVEGLSLRELETRLSLSERQLRREHARALQALTTLLWDELAPGSSPLERDEGPSSERWNHNLRSFEITHESLDPVEVLQGVIRTFQPRAHLEGAEVHLALPEPLPRVLADRVMLRQILLSLLGYALETHADGPIVVTAEAQPNQVMLMVQFQADELSWGDIEEERASLEAARYSAQRLNLTFQEAHVPESHHVRLSLTLPRADQPTVLVVDDQEPAIRMFRRFLSHTPLHVVGVQDGAQALPLARRLQPSVITLDVMMPRVDGWEILQMLHTDPETQHIPIIVCSIWDEPELAFSLGAAEFLKKPITQRDLLAALTRLKLLDTSAEPPPTDFSG